MITRTSLMNINLQAKVFVAMKQAVRQSARLGNYGWIEMSNGMWCRHSRKGLNGFSFYDKKGNNITAVMLQALRD